MDLNGEIIFSTNGPSLPMEVQIGRLACLEPEGHTYVQYCRTITDFCKSTDLF